MRRPEIDRFPVCGHDGGTYKRDNIVPSCARCNKRRCVGFRCRTVLADVSQFERRAA